MTTKQPSSLEIEFIKKAAVFLENPSFLIKLTNIIGKPVEKGIELLPPKAQDLVATATRKALDKALSLAIKTISTGEAGSFEIGQENSSTTNLFHAGATAVLGMASGAVGVIGLPVELPITTSIMLRSIASIANDHGQDVNTIKTRLECLTVFAMGSASKEDDAMDSAYFTSRLALSKFVDEAAKWAAKKTGQEISAAISAKSAPVLIQFISKIAARYNVVVTDALLAKAIPGVAMVTGAMINAAFTDYFNTVAHFHFGILALEERYGEGTIRALYEKNKPEGH